MSDKTINNEATEEKTTTSQTKSKSKQKVKNTDKKSDKTKTGKKTKATDKKEKEIQELKKQVEEIQEKYLRLSAEYDNYRKRTLKEKIELAQSGGKDIIIGLLPVVDDFERAKTSLDNNHDIKAVKEGIDLIYTKFTDFLKARGVKEIESMHKDFDTDVHEALTKIPTPNKKLKGKIVDIIEKGYFLNDKVIRYSKVVVGE